MCEYYFDEERAVAYKVYPAVVSIIRDEKTDNREMILVHTNIKATNFRKEKIRRTFSKLYSPDEFTPETAREDFIATMLPKLFSGARKISDKEYEDIKARVEF